MMDGSVDERLCNIKHDALTKIIDTSLKSIESRIEDRDKTLIRIVELSMQNIETRLVGMDKALEVHAKEMERRLEGLNDLRTDVIKDRDQFVKREMYDTRISSSDKNNSEISRRLTVIETRSVVWTAAIAMFFVVLQVAVYLWKR